MNIINLNDFEIRLIFLYLKDNNKKALIKNLVDIPSTETKKVKSSTTKDPEKPPKGKNSDNSFV